MSENYRKGGKALLALHDAVAIIESGSVRKGGRVVRMFPIHMEDARGYPVAFSEMKQNKPGIKRKYAVLYTLPMSPDGNAIEHWAFYIWESGGAYIMNSEDVMLDTFEVDQEAFIRVLTKKTQLK